MTHPLRGLLLLAALLGAAGSSAGSPLACGDVPIESLRRACLTDALSSADRQLNDAYQRSVQNAPDAIRKALRDAQRRWIASRNAQCQFNEKGLEDRAAWLDAAVKDPARADCLIQQTTNRTRDLSAQEAPSPTGASILFAEVKPAQPDSAHAIRSVRAHRAGRFYFEVVVDHGSAVPGLEADIQVRLRGGRKFIATTYSIRPQDLVMRMGDESSVTIVGGNLGSIRLPRTVIGVAVDLDARRLFRHHDGEWKGQSPSAGQGLGIPHAEEYFAEVYSSVSIDSLVRDKTVRVNFGAEPFAYALPAGYVAFDAAQATEAAAMPHARFETVAADALVDGLPLSSWIQRYWRWSRSFPAGETPADDSTGARCNAGQTEPVFFLTGSSKTAAISRVCTIPRGQYVFIPLINVLAQANVASNATCSDLMDLVRQVNDSVANLKMTINGQAVASPAFFNGESGCFDLRDASRNASGRAAGAGYWAVLAPIEAGSYEIRFEGRYRADGFAQSVRYQLKVE